MSIRSGIQPWTAWQLEDKLSDIFLITPTTSLIPFQIISSEVLTSVEITPYGEDGWSVIDIGATDVTYGSVHVISYDGSDLDSPLACGRYQLRVNAGETWYLEPILVDDFDIDTNDYSRRDNLWLPLRFSENEYWLDGAIVSDGNLPFMFKTDHPIDSPVVYLEDCECGETELTGFPLTASTIDGFTYYIYDGSVYSLPENSCGIYRFKIVDGDYCYYSVPFELCDFSGNPDYDFGGIGSLTADSTEITADSTVVTADD